MRWIPMWLVAALEAMRILPSPCCPLPSDHTGPCHRRCAYCNRGCFECTGTYTDPGDNDE